MRREDVNSTNIRSIGYESESCTLEIEFRGGGIYQYLGVPKVTYEELMAAHSCGSYFHQHIRDKYQWIKIS